MKTALTILTLVIHACYLNAQTYINLQAGVAGNTNNTNQTLTYQVGVRYQPSVIGFKASFNQTDGLYHTFDSYTLSGTFEPAEAIYLSVGYRHDNGRGWGPYRNGASLSGNLLIPLNFTTRLIGTVDTFISDIVINNVMIGVQLDFRLSKTKPKRFF